MSTNHLVSKTQDTSILAKLNIPFIFLFVMSKAYSKFSNNRNMFDMLVTFEVSNEMD